MIPFMKGTAQSSLLRWWRKQRSFSRSILESKKAKGSITVVEEMILNPFTLDQAHDQVNFLNGGAQSLRMRATSSDGEATNGSQNQVSAR
jgi:hypothetical protein